MRIALTYPRFNYDSNLPLGLAYIASVLEKSGQDVKIAEKLQSISRCKSF
jgi:hypothetical protein